MTLTDNKETVIVSVSMPRPIKKVLYERYPKSQRSKLIVKLLRKELGLND